MSDDKKRENETENGQDDNEDEEIEHSSAQPAEGDPDAGTHSGISSELPVEG